MTSAEYQQLVESLDRRFDEAGLRVAELRQDMLGHFDAIDHRFERLEPESHAITQALRRIEAGLAASAAGVRSSSAPSQS
jgi:hypothetical protein